MWLLTSGPTREHLDDVRFLSNASSGQMGHAIARAARERGHDVTVVQGPVALDPPEGVRVVDVVSAREMLEAALRILREAEADVEVVLGVAAVCDLRPERRVRGKPAKADVALHLDLVPNPDVLATLAAERRARFHVGFALQDLGTDAAGLGRAEVAAREKLSRKGLDAIVLNGVESMEARATRAWWIARGADRVPLAGRETRGAEARALDKGALARQIVERCESGLIG